MLEKKVREKLEDCQKAYQRLEESLQLEPVLDIVIDGVIQRFEFTFEQSWKLMQAYLQYDGIEEAKSPRTTIRAAFKYGLINEGDEWINMMLDRNKTSYLYDANLAKAIYENIKGKYSKLFALLLTAMEEKNL